ncbi:MAG: cytochrome P450 [Gammaproteobacteria bacterium]|nr:cytochrome P450 [Gammaproteobacteria bacterium]
MNSTTRNSNAANSHRKDTAGDKPGRSVEPGWYGADPLTMDLKSNPHDAYRQLREQQPVNLTPAGDWRLSRYADIQQLLKHSNSGVRDTRGRIPEESQEDSDNSKFMLRLDPPDHDRIRNLVTKAFTPRALAAMRPAIEPLVSGELDRISACGTMDVVADLALTVPAASMCAMLGVPFQDRHELTELVSLATYRLAKLAIPDMQEQADAALFKLGSYMYALIEERRRRPTDDILSLLVQAEEAGERLSNDELLQQSIGLLIAGLETTIGLIANGMLCFSRHPDQFEKLAADPTLVHSAVEECLRFEPSVPVTRRILWEDTEFGGVTLPADAIVYAVIIGANRDPAVFSQPDRFDIARNEARHCSFGGGIHFCLGSHLARMNAEIAFLAMAQRFRDFHADDSQLQWAPSLFRIPGRLPATFKCRA